MRIQIKPLSVNQAWNGRRFKSDAYKAYETEAFYKLRPMNIPEGKLKLCLIVGYSNKASDIDNCVKMWTDILQKNYGFNDNNIYHLCVEKDIVPKGQEYISFTLTPYERTR